MLRCAQTVAVTGMLLLALGCSRWTLRPPADMPAPHAGPRMNELASLASGMGNPPGVNAAATAAANEQALDLQDLRNLDPSLAIARLTERQGDPQEARRMYTLYLEKHPKHPLPHHRLGVMAAREAKYEEAEHHFHQSMKLGGPNAELLSDVGYLYYLMHRLNEAEQVLQQASQAEPANERVHNNLALVLAARGDYSNSLRNFRKVNEEAQAHANLAYTYSQHGELAQARSEYLRALTYDNKLKNAAKALLQVNKAQNMQEQAVANAEARHRRAADPLLQTQPQPASHLPDGQVNDSRQRFEQIGFQPPRSGERMAREHPEDWEVSLHKTETDISLPRAVESDAPLAQPDHPAVDSVAKQSAPQRHEFDAAQMLMPLPDRASKAPQPSLTTPGEQVASQNAAEFEPETYIAPETPLIAPRFEEVQPVAHYEPVAPPDEADYVTTAGYEEEIPTSTDARPRIVPVEMMFGSLGSLARPMTNATDQAPAQLPPLRTREHSASGELVSQAAWWTQEGAAQNVQTTAWAGDTRAAAKAPTLGVSVGFSDDASDAQWNAQPSTWQQPQPTEIQPSAATRGVDISLKDDTGVNASLSD